MKNFSTLFLLTAIVTIAYSAPLSKQEKVMNQILSTLPWSPYNSPPYRPPHNFYGEEISQQRKLREDALKVTDFLRATFVSRKEAKLQGESFQDLLLNFIGQVSNYTQGKLRSRANSMKDTFTSKEHHGYVTMQTRLHQLQGWMEQLSYLKPEAVGIGEDQAIDVAAIAECDLDAFYADIVDMFANALHKFADIVYKNASNEYGKHKPENDAVQNIAKLFHLIANNIKVDSLEIDGNMRDTINTVFRTISNSFSSLYGLIKKGGPERKDQPQVVVPDGWQFPFNIFQGMQSVFGPELLKRIEKDDTIPDNEKKIYKSFLNIIPKLYGSETLNATEKLALNNSMKLFLKQIDDTKLSAKVKGAIKNLINIFLKKVCGKDLSTEDKKSAFKSFTTLWLAKLTGNLHIRSLKLKTVIFINSLLPIMSKIILSELSQGLKRARGGELDPGRRMILCAIAPTVKTVLTKLFEDIHSASNREMNANLQHLFDDHYFLKSQTNGEESQSTLGFLLPVVASAVLSKVTGGEMKVNEQGFRDIAKEMFRMSLTYLLDQLNNKGSNPGTSEEGPTQQDGFAFNVRPWKTPREMVVNEQILKFIAPSLVHEG